MADGRPKQLQVSLQLSTWRLTLALALVVGSVSSVTLLWVEGYSPRAMIVLGLSLMLTSACGMWFAVRGRWD